MKTLIIKYLTSVILLFTCSAIYSQSDTELIYYPNDLSISYSVNSLKTLEFQAGEKAIIMGLQEMDDVSKLRFLNDSMVSVSNDVQSNVQMNIKRINKISIKNGTHIGLGLGLGALAGLGIAAVVIAGANENNSENPLIVEPLLQSWKIVTGFLWTAGGALAGLIVGGNINSYKTYELNNKTYDKKSEIERILMIDNQKSGRVKK